MIDMGSSSGPRRNRSVLLILIDDLGDDAAPWGKHSGRKAQCNFLQQKAASAAIYDLITMPECCVTRAALLTGQYPHLNGYTSNDSFVQGPLDLAGKASLYHEMKMVGYDVIHVGKWHLGRLADHHPIVECGADRFVGTEANLTSHYDWEQTTLIRQPGGGVHEQTSHQWEYSALAQVRKMSHLIAAQQQGPRKALFVLACNAPHAAFDTPPDGTYSTGGGSAHASYLQSMECLDSLLHQVWSDDLDIMVCSDNGTPHGFSAYPDDQRKGSVGMGGVKSTLMCWGEGFVPGHRQVLTNIVDLRPTILDLVGAPSFPRRSGRSFAPSLTDPTWTRQRTHAFAEIDSQTQEGQRMIQDGQWKLRQWMPSMRETWHDLTIVPDEDGPDVGEAAVPPDVVRFMRQKVSE